MIGKKMQATLGPIRLLSLELRALVIGTPPKPPQPFPVMRIALSLPTLAGITKANVRILVERVDPKRAATSQPIALIDVNERGVITQCFNVSNSDPKVGENLTVSVYLEGDQDKPLHVGHAVVAAGPSQPRRY